MFRKKNSDISDEVGAAINLRSWCAVEPIVRERGIGTWKEIERCESQTYNVSEITKVKKQEKCAT
jgi:hypothetical protein